MPTLKMDGTTEKFESDLLTRMLEEETRRAPTPREMRMFKKYQGLAPHRRPGPPHWNSPTIGVPEIFTTRAVVTYLLAREYGFTLSEIRDILKYEDNASVEKFLALGDELAPGSAVATRMKEVLYRAAQKVIALVRPIEEKERMLALLEPSKIKPAKKPAARNGATILRDIRNVRALVVHLLNKELGLLRRNIRPLVGYLSRTEVWMLEGRSHRLLERMWADDPDRPRIVAAAKAIVAKAES